MKRRIHLLGHRLHVEWQPKKARYFSCRPQRISEQLQVIQPESLQMRPPVEPGEHLIAMRFESGFHGCWIVLRRPSSAVPAT